MCVLKASHWPASRTTEAPYKAVQHSGCLEDKAQQPCYILNTSTCRITEANYTQEQLTVRISTFSTHKTGNECRKNSGPLHLHVTEVLFGEHYHVSVSEIKVEGLKLYQRDKQNPNNSQQQPSCYTLHSNLLHSLHAPWIWYKQRPAKKIHYEIKAGIRPRKQCGLLGLPRVCGRCPSCTTAALSFHGSASVASITWYQVSSSLVFPLDCHGNVMACHL